MLANTRQTYGLVAQILHWITAALILFLLVLGVYMHELPIETPTQVDEKIWLYSLHKTLGLTTFVIAIIRVLWAIIQPRPMALNSERKWESWLAGTIHWVLYGAIILMPITGWMHHAATEGFAPIWWPFGQDLLFVPKDAHLAELLGNAHFFTALLLMGSIFFHVAGAIKHVVVDRDQTLARMLPGKHVLVEDIKEQSSSKRGTVLAAGGIFALLAVAIFSGYFAGHTHDHSHSASNANSNSGWVVDHEKSRLEIEVLQSGKPSTGTFKTWQANINFDPDKLTDANVQVEIDITSLDLGGNTKQALSKDFLNVEAFQTAVFTSENFTRNEDGTYQAIGELTVSGKTHPLTFSFDLEIEDNRARMKGGATIMRLDHGVGEKGFKADGLVGFAVTVKVELEAEQQ